MKTLAGSDIELSVFLSMDEDQPLGLCVFHKFGASIVELNDFIEESRVDLSTAMRQRYACAFEIMAKQLRVKA